MKTFKLTRTVQCAKCPWKVTTDPHQIPNGYCQTKHRDLSNTISRNVFDTIGRSRPAMSCHESSPDQPDYCIGWLENQLGVGNNIGLRMRMLDCENIGQIRTIGEQHERFEDTLP